MDGRNPETERPGLSQFVAARLGLIGLGLVGAGLLVLLRPAGRAEPPGLDLRRDRQHRGRDRPAQRPGDQVIAKILLAVIALLSASAASGSCTRRRRLVSLLQPKWRDRILPWVFVGPALLLLAVFLVYPAVVTILRSFQDNEGQLTLENYDGAWPTRRS